MMVNQAIKRTRKEVAENNKWNADWNADYKMWQQITKPADKDKIAWMKAQKVAYAAGLLGYDRNNAFSYGFQPGSWEEILRAFVEEKGEVK